MNRAKEISNLLPDRVEVVEVLRIFSGNDYEVSLDSNNSVADDPYCI